MSRRWLPPVLWAVLIFVLTALPGDTVPDVGDVPTGTDKVLHAAFYGILGWLTVRAAWRPGRSWGAWGLALLLIACLAAVNEWMQTFVPGRSPNSWDWVADVLGAAVGMTIGVAMRRREHGT